MPRGGGGRCQPKLSAFAHPFLILTALEFPYPLQYAQMGVGKAIEENEEAKQGAMNAQRACIAKTRTQKNRTQKLRDAKGGGGGGRGSLSTIAHPFGFLAALGVFLSLLIWQDGQGKGD